MKVRVGFVSNSSSSSFVLQKEHVTPAQLKLIRNHIHKARKLNQELSKGDQFYVRDSDVWHLYETEKTLEGSHYIDNFDMEKYFRLLGLPEFSFVFFDKDASWDDWTVEDCRWEDWKGPDQ